MTIESNRRITAVQEYRPESPVGNILPGSIINPIRYTNAGGIPPNERGAFEEKLLRMVRTLRETIHFGQPINVVMSHALMMLREMQELPRYSAPDFGRLRTTSSFYEISEELFPKLELLWQDDEEIRWDTTGEWTEEGVQSGTFLTQLSNGNKIDLSQFTVWFEEGEVHEAVFKLTSPAHFSDIMQECDYLLFAIRLWHANTDYLSVLIPTLFWWMVQGSFFKEGNAEIFELIVSACMDENALRPWDEELDAYDAALCMNKEEFLNFCSILRK
ncbi:MAG: hypothetical protein JSR58_06475 [Verrucomicrobia bacterium]|nr:hypothetical protein [Verrucomicrobiota bacterium]